VRDTAMPNTQLDLAIGRQSKPPADMALSTGLELAQAVAILVW
jgi:hypothetical protein